VKPSVKPPEKPLHFLEEKMQIEVPIPVLEIPRPIEQWLRSMNVQLDKPVTLIFKSEKRDEPRI